LRRAQATHQRRSDAVLPVMRLACSAFVLFACSASYAQRPPDFAVPPAQREALTRGIFDELRSKYVFPERLEAAFAEMKRRWERPEFAKLDHAHALVDRVNADLRDIF